MSFALSEASAERVRNVLRNPSFDCAVKLQSSAQDEVNRESRIDFHWGPVTGLFYPHLG